MRTRNRRVRGALEHSACALLGFQHRFATESAFQIRTRRQKLTATRHPTLALRRAKEVRSFRSDEVRFLVRHLHPLVKVFILLSEHRIDRHILRRLWLWHGSTSAFITSIVVPGHAKHSPNGTVVPHSEVRRFIVIPKVGFIKPINTTSTAVLRDSIRLEKDIVVKAGISDD